MERARPKARMRAKAEARGANGRFLKTWMVRSPDQIGDALFATYKVHSRSGSEWYRVTVIERLGARGFACECRGWFYRGSCTHSAAVERRLEARGIMDDVVTIDRDGYRAIGVQLLREAQGVIDEVAGRVEEVPSVEGVNDIADEMFKRLGETREQALEAQMKLTGEDFRWLGVR